MVAILQCKLTLTGKFIIERQIKSLLFGYFNEF